MRHHTFIAIATITCAACAGPQQAPSPAATSTTESARPAAGSAAPAPQPTSTTPATPAADPEGFALRTAQADDRPSNIKATATEAAVKFTVVDKDKGPVKGIVISLTGADGRKYYTEETNADGYAEVLVPIGQKYDLVFLSLGRRDITSSVDVPNEPRQNIRLTLRYKRQSFEPAGDATSGAPRFVLQGVNFDTGKATIRPESFPRLDTVVEFLTHKKSARIEISGHTDNQGNPKVNKALSQKRAQACRSYLISKGIDGARVTAVGYGDERPVAANDTEDGRQRNRRIEATEM